MSVLFGLYQPEQGIIKKNGEEVKIKDPNDATALHIGMVHQHFKLVDVFTVLDNIIPVSYTHLDVYKRQAWYSPARRRCAGRWLSS